MTRVSITHMSNAHNGWLRSLDFYKQEIKILKGLLTEIAKKNTSAPVMKEVEHFENQFRIQLENIAKLAHDIKGNLTDAGKQAHASGAGYIDGILLSTHTALGEKYIVEEKIVNELRHSFQQFAAEWM